MESITVTFKHRNDTKGTRRFQEVAEEGAEVIGSLYVKKSANVTADTLTVTISDGAASKAKGKRSSK